MTAPRNFSRITPYIFVEGADEYMRHLAEALGGVETGRSERPDGKIANGQLRIHDATIMISEASPAFPVSKAAYYFYVDDADAALARAVAAGMTTIMEVDDMPYGDRQGGVKDRAGNIWWVSQRLSDDPYFPD